MRAIYEFPAFVPQVKEILTEYMAKKIDEAQLIAKLKGVERQLKKTLEPRPKKDESIWFRFFRQDTGATDLREIEETLAGNRGLRNKGYMLENMEIAISNEENPVVCFS